VQLHTRQVAQDCAGAHVVERHLKGLEGHLNDEGDVELEARHGMDLSHEGQDARNHGVGVLEHLRHRQQQQQQGGIGRFSTVLCLD
jgi:hypothetical protein